MLRPFWINLLGGRWEFYLLLYLFLTGIVSFIFNKGHLLSSLISLEYISLVLFLTISCLQFSRDRVYFSIVYITIAVCGGALGLGTLVLYARGRGREYAQASGVRLW